MKNIRLKLLRMAADLTQQEASRKTGIYVTKLSDFENGHKIPDERECKKLAKAYRCDVNDVYEALQSRKSA